MFFPEYSENQLSLWFHDSIIDIESTPIFGFIFKVIGFIFIVNLFSKLITSLNLIFSRKNNNSNDTDIKEDDNKFDEFEEIE